MTYKKGGQKIKKKEIHLPFDFENIETEIRFQGEKRENASTATTYPAKSHGE